MCVNAQFINYINSTDKNKALFLNQIGFTVDNNALLMNRSRFGFILISVSKLK